MIRSFLSCVVDNFEGYYLTGPSHQHFMGHDTLNLTTFNAFGQSLPLTFTVAINWSFGWLAAIMSLIITGFLLSCFIPRFGLWCFREDSYSSRKCDGKKSKLLRACCEMEESQLKVPTYQTIGAVFVLIALGLVPFNGKEIRAARWAYLDTFDPTNTMNQNPLLDRIIYLVLAPLLGAFFFLILLRIRRHNAGEGRLLEKAEKPEHKEAFRHKAKRWFRHLIMNQFACLLLIWGIRTDTDGGKCISRCSEQTPSNTT